MVFLSRQRPNSLSNQDRKTIGSGDFIGIFPKKRLTSNFHINSSTSSKREEAIYAAHEQGDANSDDKHPPTDFESTSKKIIKTPENSGNLFDKLQIKSNRTKKVKSTLKLFPRKVRSNQNDNLSSNYCSRNFKIKHNSFNSQCCSLHPSLSSCKTADPSRLEINRNCIPDQNTFLKKVKSNFNRNVVEKGHNEKKTRVSKTKLIYDVIHFNKSSFTNRMKTLYEKPKFFKYLRAKNTKTDNELNEYGVKNPNCIQPSCKPDKKVLFQIGNKRINTGDKTTKLFHEKTTIKPVKGILKGATQSFTVNNVESPNKSLTSPDKKNNVFKNTEKKSFELSNTNMKNNKKIHLENSVKEKNSKSNANFYVSEQFLSFHDGKLQENTINKDKLQLLSAVRENDKIIENRYESILDDSDSARFTDDISSSGDLHQEWINCNNSIVKKKNKMNCHLTLTKAANAIAPFPRAGIIIKEKRSNNFNEQAVKSISIGKRQSRQPENNSLLNACHFFCSGNITANKNILTDEEVNLLDTKKYTGKQNFKSTMCSKSAIKRKSRDSCTKTLSCQPYNLKIDRKDISTLKQSQTQKPNKVQKTKALSRNSWKNKLLKNQSASTKDYCNKKESLDGQKRSLKQDSEKTNKNTKVIFEKSKVLREESSSSRISSKTKAKNLKKTRLENGALRKTKKHVEATLHVRTGPQSNYDSLYERDCFESCSFITNSCKNQNSYSRDNPCSMSSASFQDFNTSDALTQSSNTATAIAKAQSNSSFEFARDRENELPGFPGSIKVAVNFTTQITDKCQPKTWSSKTSGEAIKPRKSFGRKRFKIDPSLNHKSVDNISKSVSAPTSCLKKINKTTTLKKMFEGLKIKKPTVCNIKNEAKSKAYKNKPSGDEYSLKHRHTLTAKPVVNGKKSFKKKPIGSAKVNYHEKLKLNVQNKKEKEKSSSEMSKRANEKTKKKISLGKLWQAANHSAASFSRSKKQKRDWTKIENLSGNRSLLAIPPTSYRTVRDDSCKRYFSKNLNEARLSNCSSTNLSLVTTRWGMSNKKRRKIRNKKNKHSGTCLDSGEDEIRARGINVQSTAQARSTKQSRDAALLYLRGDALLMSHQKPQASQKFSKKCRQNISLVEDVHCLQTVGRLQTSSTAQTLRSGDLKLLCNEPRCVFLRNVSSDFDINNRSRWKGDWNSFQNFEPKVTLDETMKLINAHDCDNSRKKSFQLHQNDNSFKPFFPHLFEKHGLIPLASSIVKSAIEGAKADCRQRYVENSLPSLCDPKDKMTYAFGIANYLVKSVTKSSQIAIHAEKEFNSYLKDLTKKVAKEAVADDHISKAVRAARRVVIIDDYMKSSPPFCNKQYKTSKSIHPNLLLHASGSKSSTATQKNKNNLFNNLKNSEKSLMGFIKNAPSVYDFHGLANLKHASKSLEKTKRFSRFLAENSLLQHHIKELVSDMVRAVVISENLKLSACSSKAEALQAYRLSQSEIYKNKPKEENDHLEIFNVKQDACQTSNSDSIKSDNVSFPSSTDLSSCLECSCGSTLTPNYSSSNSSYQLTTFDEFDYTFEELSERGSSESSRNVVSLGRKIKHGRNESRKKQIRKFEKSQSKKRKLKNILPAKKKHLVPKKGISQEFKSEISEFSSSNNFTSSRIR